MKGYVCSSDSEQVFPGAIACLLHRVHYVRAADNEALAALLGKDTAKPCGARLLHSNGMGEQAEKRSIYKVHLEPVFAHVPLDKVGSAIPAFRATLPLRFPLPR